MLTKTGYGGGHAALKNPVLFIHISKDMHNGKAIMHADHSLRKHGRCFEPSIEQPHDRSAPQGATWIEIPRKKYFKKSNTTKTFLEEHATAITRSERG